MSSMRILWLVNIALPPVRARQGLPPLPSGGWLSSTLEALALEAPDLEIVCATRGWPPHDPFDLEGVRYVTIPREPPRGRWRGVVYNWSIPEDMASLGAEMRSLVAQTRPDLIHIHGTERPDARALQLAAGQRPVLISLQGSVRECATHFYEGLSAADVFFDVANPEFLKGRGLVHQRRWLMRAAGWARETLASATDVAGRTDWDRELAARANPRARYWRIEEVLRKPFYEAHWRGAAGGEPVIVAIAGAAPYKGVDVLLRAFARIRAVKTCRLKVLGPLEGTALWPSLRRLEAELGLEGAVDWAGERDASDVAEALSSCSVAVCASRVENSSNSVCEAMLVGAPVVASRTGGIPSLVAHEENGLLFSVGDDEALASAILRVLQDDALARHLGSRAQRTAMARHDPASVARRTLDVYSELGSDGPA
jgi:glycosyltransferase involved in cell wall biosynthesis